jgi:hypothetical protein
VPLAEPFHVDESTPLGRAVAEALADDAHPRVDLVRRLKDERPQISMLGRETLRAIHLMSGLCRHTIVEIGAYVGGPTIPILEASQARGNQVLVIEEPVAALHSSIPTENSVAQLRANLTAFGVDRAGAHVIPGASFETWVLGEVRLRLMQDSIGLLVWDADSCFDRDLALLAPYLAEGCMLMADDYSSGGAKTYRVTAFIDEMVRRGMLETVAHLPWCTWFGRLLRRPALDEIAEWRAEWRVMAAGGDVYYKRLLDYEARLGQPPQPFTFEERAAFWQRARDWHTSRGF